MESRLVQAQSQANIDALTGVKNMHAYKEMEARLDRQITNHRQTSFAIVIFDVNDLKKVNDTSGHHAGDQYLRDACRIICDIFKHSPVFRVGGDEFAVITQERDYACIDELLEKVNMAKYENDPCVVSVFERADKEMYKNKCALKKGKSWECLCSTDKTTDAP